MPFRYRPYQYIQGSRQEEISWQFLLSKSTGAKYDPSASNFPLDSENFVIQIAIRTI